MKSPVTDLCNLLTTHHDRELSALTSILEEERVLRQKLAKLRDQESSARTELGIDPTPRTIGADTLWQSWLGRNFSELNTRLANTLVRKSHAQEKLRQAFGRKTVAEELVQIERDAAKDMQRRKDLNSILQLGLLERLR